MAGFIFLIAALLILPYILAGIYMVFAVIFGLGKVASDKADKNHKIRQEENEKQRKRAEHNSNVEKLLTKQMELRNSLNESPHDFRLRLRLADTLYSMDKAEEAIDELLHIVSRDKNWNDGLARKKLLAIFNDLGDEDPIVIRARYRLSSILFL